MAVRRTRIFGGLLGGYRWREIPRRRSRSILHGILFGWRGKPLVKSRGKRGDTYSRGEGGSSPRKIGNAPRKFSSVAVILPEIRVSENLRERKREGKNYRFLPSKRQVTRILSDYFFFFFWERSDIVRRCNLELELFSLLVPDISTRGSFFPWIRRGVS